LFCFYEFMLALYVCVSADSFTSLPPVIPGTARAVWLRVVHELMSWT